VLLKTVYNLYKKRLCILLYISKLKVDIHHKYFLIMHNLKSNFDKILNITKSFYKGSIDADHNYYFYPNKPKMSDCEIIALSLVGENIYLVDSIPVPICKNARINRSKICKDDYETAPDRGYSAVTKSYFYGYKLHLATSIRGVYSSMELTKASIHDIHFLNEVKHSRIENCALIGDKGYVSEPIQQDLFTTRQIKLFTPVKSGQHDKEPFPFIFMKSRKRIETLFSQLCDQLMLKRNYAKSTKGLSVCILCKITAVTLLQYINYKNEKPLNHLKYALAS